MKQKKIKLTPAAGYLLIEPDKKETKTVSGIYLPDNASDKPQRGTVVAVGAAEITDHGAKKVSPVKVGDFVVYKKWGGNEVKHEDREYMFIKFEDILATVVS